MMIDVLKKPLVACLISFIAVAASTGYLFVFQDSSARERDEALEEENADGNPTEIRFGETTTLAGNRRGDLVEITFTDEISFLNQETIAIPVAVTNVGNTTNTVGFEANHIRVFGPNGRALEQTNYNSALLRDSDIRNMHNRVRYGSTFNGYFHVTYAGTGEYIIELGQNFSRHDRDEPEIVAILTFNFQNDFNEETVPATRAQAVEIPEDIEEIVIAAVDGLDRYQYISRDNTRSIALSNHEVAQLLDLPVEWLTREADNSAWIVLDLLASNGESLEIRNRSNATAENLISWTFTYDRNTYGDLRIRIHKTFDLNSNLPGISASNFALIEDGMTIEDVRDLLGSQGTMAASSGNTATYRWSQEFGGGVTRIIYVTFESGHVVAREMTEERAD